MAKRLSTQAQLQLSVTQALEQIKKLSAELKAVKEQTSQPMKVGVQLDLTKFNQQADQIKKILGGTRNSKGQFSTIAAEVRAIRSELTKLNSTIKAVGESLGVAGKNGQQMSKDLNRSLSGNSQQITGLVNNVEQFNVSLRRSGEEADNFKNKSSGAFSAAMTRLSLLVSGANQAYAAFRSVGTGFLSTLGNIANKAMDTVGFSVNGMVDEAMEQERKLQQSAIGFRNMFPSQDPNSAIKLVRKTAAESPGLNSGDLADYINQLGAVSGGSFDTAYNATLGILKTVQYGGGDAASQMNYIIKNVRDVMAKGKATQVDIQQFNRAMPLLAKVMDAIGASEFLKDGQLTITKDNASKLMEAFAKLNTPDNPAYGIYADTAKTLAGIQEEFRETTASTIAEGLEDIGFFDALSNIMRKSVLPEIQGDIKTFFQWISEIAGDIDWKEVQKTVGEVVREIKGLIGELSNYLKDNVLNTEGIKLAIRVVGEFIKGLISGAQTLAKWLNNIRQYLGDDGLMNLARTLGQTVTQGWLASKALGAVAGVLETVSHVAQASFFFGRNVGGGAAASTASAGLGLLSGSIAPGSTAQKIGNAAYTYSGGLIPAVPVAKGAAAVGSVAGKAVGFISKAAGKTIKGGAVSLLTDVASDLIRNFNLLSGASEATADILKVGGAAIGAAITGSILGPLGSLGAALISTVFTLNSLEFEKEQKAAEEAGVKALALKDEGAKTILQGAIDTLRSFKDDKGEQMFTFDERTDAAQWAKNQVIEYLNNTKAGEWDEEMAYSRLVRAYAQKLGHEYVVKADNQYGFWDLQGQQVEYVKKNKAGEDEITAYGERLVDMIRAYNLVGYDSLQELEATTDQTLINQYLQSENLNLAQLEFLENQAKAFEEQTGTKITGTAKKLNGAIDKYGTIEGAIDAAKKAGDEAWVATLEAYQALRDEANKVKDEILKTGESNKYWDEATAKEFLKEEGAKKYMEWVNRGGLDSWGDFLGDNATQFRNLFNTEGMHPSKGPAIVIKNLQEELQRLQTNAENGSLPEEERKKDQAAANAIQQFLTNLPDAGDWDSLTPEALRMAEVLLQNNRGTALFGSDQTGLVVINGRSFAKSDTAAILEELRKWLLAHPQNGGGGGGFGWANGGFIQPVFRANGGMSGKGVDIVPAFLQPGEFVQRKTAVETAGLSVMQALNNGDLAQAYKLIGSKISGHWNQSRNDYSSRDNRRYQSNNFFIRNYNRSGRAGTKASLANHLALGY